VLQQLLKNAFAEHIETKCTGYENPSRLSWNNTPSNLTQCKVPNFINGWRHMKMQCTGPLEYNFFSFKKIQHKFVNRSPYFHVFKLIADTDISVFRNYQSTAYTFWAYKCWVSKFLVTLYGGCYDHETPVDRVWCRHGMSIIGDILTKYFVWLNTAIFRQNCATIRL